MSRCYCEKIVYLINIITGLKVTYHNFVYVVMYIFCLFVLLKFNDQINNEIMFSRSMTKINSSGASLPEAIF